MIGGDDHCGGEDGDDGGEGVQCSGVFACERATY